MFVIFNNLLFKEDSEKYAKNWNGGESNINRYNIYLPVWSHHLQDEQDLLYFRRVLKWSNTHKM